MSGMAVIFHFFFSLERRRKKIFFWCENTINKIVTGKLTLYFQRTAKKKIFFPFIFFWDIHWWLLCVFFKKSYNYGYYNNTFEIDINLGREIKVQFI